MWAATGGPGSPRFPRRIARAHRARRGGGPRARRVRKARPQLPDVVANTWPQGEPGAGGGGHGPKASRRPPSRARKCWRSQPTRRVSGLRAHRNRRCRSTVVDPYAWIGRERACHALRDGRVELASAQIARGKAKATDPLRLLVPVVEALSRGHSVRCEDTKHLGPPSLRSRASRGFPPGQDSIRKVRHRRQALDPLRAEPLS